MKRRDALIDLLVFFAFLALSALLSVTLVGADDHWWHIAEGKRILANGEIRDFDEFSFTYWGAPWKSVEWLFDLFLAVVWEHAGAWGLYLSRVCSFALLLFFSYRLLVSGGYENSNRLKLHSFLFTCLLIVVYYYRSSYRPHTYAYVALAMGLWLMGNLVRLPRRWVLGIVWMLFLVWRNFHPSWILGLILCTVLLGDAVFNAIKKGQVAHLTPLLVWWPVIVFSTFLLSPQPFDFSLYSGHHAGVGDIAEWLPFWQFTRPFPFLFGATVLFLLFVLQTRFSIRRFPLLTLTCGALGLLALYKHRFAIEFTIGFLALGGHRFFLWWRIVRGRFFFMRKVPRAGWVVGVMAIVFLSSFYHILLMDERIGIGIDERKNPVGAVTFMKKMEVEGTLIANSTPAQAYVIGMMWPRMRVYIDGRIPTLYPVAFLNEYAQKGAIQRAVEKEKVDVVLIHGGIFQNVPDGFLRYDGYYTVVYFDEYSVLLIRNDRLAKYPFMPRFRILLPWRLFLPGYLKHFSETEKSTIQKEKDNLLILQKIVGDKLLYDTLREALAMY